MSFFIADTDNNKRVKVVEWMVDEDEIKAIIAKKLGVLPEQIKSLRVLTKNGKHVIVAAIETNANPKAPAVVAFSPYGKRILLESDLSGTSYLRPLKAKADATVVEGWMADVANPTVIAANDTLYAFKGTGIWSANLNKLLVYSFPTASAQVWNDANLSSLATDSDAEFLKRVLKDVRGSEPTALENQVLHRGQRSKEAPRNCSTNC